MAGRGGEYEADEEGEEGGPEELSLDEEEQTELLEEWAASEIQTAWRKYQLRRGAQDSQGGVKRLPPSSTRQATAASSGEICCACFAPLTLEDSSERDPHAASIQLFCLSCQHQLERGSRGLDTHGNGTPIASSFASPLPKLGLLVQTEAKYQDQLRLLRQQQELLRQQQQEIETRKKMQAETQQIAKQLARQRRRHFQQIMARRQAEEAQKIQEMAGRQGEEPPMKRRSKPVNPPVETASSSVVIAPGQLRRHHIPAPPQSSKTQDAASKAAELAEKAAQEHRRKQRVETMKCYAQDLTPLVHGQKPKKLPLPAQTPAGATGVKKSTQKPSKPSKITLVPLQKPSQKSKKPPQNNNNQQTDQPKQRQGDDFSEELRLLIPRRTSSHAMPTPLTAEIKPVSWMQELLSSDPVLKDPSHSKLSHSSTTASASILGTSLSSMTQSRTQLTALLEEDDDYGDHEHPHHHSLRSSFSGSGHRVTLAPLSSNLTSTPPASTAAPHKPEYTSERLASLLEKYHVSVSSTSTATK